MSLGLPSNSRLFNQINDIKAFQCYLILIINLITIPLSFFLFYLNSNEVSKEPTKETTFHL